MPYISVISGKISDSSNAQKNQNKTRMWADAQRDGRRAEYRWRPLFNAAVWLTVRVTRV